MKNSYKFFQNRECEYFPCHDCDDVDDFNCLFCYCPLYALGKNCPGKFTYLENGIKDCSGCLLPHCSQEYYAILSRFGDIKSLLEHLERLDDWTVQSENRDGGKE